MLLHDGDQLFVRGSAGGRSCLCSPRGVQCSCGQGCPLLPLGTADCICGVSSDLHAGQVFRNGVRTLVEEGTVVLPGVANAADYSFVYGISAAAGGAFATGLFAVMILAAVMSTMDRLMLTVGMQFSWNIIKVILRLKATEKQVIRVSQVTMLAAVIVSLLLAIHPPEVLVFLIFLTIGLILDPLRD